MEKSCSFQLFISTFRTAAFIKAWLLNSPYSINEKRANRYFPLTVYIRYSSSSVQANLKYKCLMCTLHKVMFKVCFFKVYFLLV